MPASPEFQTGRVLKTLLRRIFDGREFAPMFTAFNGLVTTPASQNRIKLLYPCSLPWSLARHGPMRGVTCRTDGTFVGPPYATNNPEYRNVQTRMIHTYQNAGAQPTSSQLEFAPDLSAMASALERQGSTYPAGTIGACAGEYPILAWGMVLTLRPTVFSRTVDAMTVQGAATSYTAVTPNTAFCGPIRFAISWKDPGGVPQSRQVVLESFTEDLGAPTSLLVLFASPVQTANTLLTPNTAQSYQQCPALLFRPSPVAGLSIDYPACNITVACRYYGSNTEAGNTVTIGATTDTQIYDTPITVSARLLTISAILDGLENFEADEGFESEITSEDAKSATDLLLALASPPPAGGRPNSSVGPASPQGYLAAV